MTIAVDWDVKHETKHTDYSTMSLLFNARRDLYYVHFEVNKIPFSHFPSSYDFCYL